MPLKLGSNLNLDKVVKSLGQKFKLVPHLDLALGEDDFVWRFDYEPKQGDDAWHPSGDCTPSLHELYRKATGQLPEEYISPALRKIFMTGHFWHQYLQWVVEHKLGFAGAHDIERRGLRSWEWLKNESNPAILDKPKPYHWATGSADICPCRIPGEGEFLVDFKTMNPRMYATGPSADYLAKWECQANIYFDFFDQERAVFVLIDKSTGDLKEMEFQRNQSLIDSIYAKWKLVGQCVAEGVEPPADEEWPLPLKGQVA